MLNPLAQESTQTTAIGWKRERAESPKLSKDLCELQLIQVNLG